MSRQIRTLIADDEPAARTAIASLLEADPEIAVVGEAADGQSALDAIRRESPDLLFLDVQMPELDGFSVLRHLNPDELPVVVFATAYDQYALKAFDAHALDYLLKPFDDARFYQAVARAKQQIRQGSVSALREQLAGLLGAADEPGERYRERLVIKEDGRATVVTVRDIDWIEADGDYLTIHAGRSRHTLRETMKDIERALDPACFVRIHRSTIVALDRIKALEPYFRGEYVVVLQDGARLKLSRGYKPRLEEALGREF